MVLNVFLFTLIAFRIFIINFYLNSKIRLKHIASSQELADKDLAEDWNSEQLVW